VRVGVLFPPQVRDWGLPGEVPLTARAAWRVLANKVGYFQTHRAQMDYPTYRRNGWPIGSGVTAAAVKLFNKRVKGTEPFWSLPGVEAILSLRALWLSPDDRWSRYWNTRPAYAKAAQSVTDPTSAKGRAARRGATRVPPVYNTRPASDGRDAG